MVAVYLLFNNYEVINDDEFYSETLQSTSTFTPG